MSLWGKPYRLFCSMDIVYVWNFYEPHNNANGMLKVNKIMTPITI
jgi:hypothetical protein